MCIIARALNINSSLGLQGHKLIAFELGKGRRTCFPVFLEGELWEGEKEDLDFIEL
jgi:hypothetical protein